MTSRKLRALARSTLLELDCAMNDLVWQDHPEVIESLNNAKELVEIILEAHEDEDEIEELEFEEW